MRQSAEQNILSALIGWHKTQTVTLNKFNLNLNSNFISDACRMNRKHDIGNRNGNQME